MAEQKAAIAENQRQVKAVTRIEFWQKFQKDEDAATYEDVAKRVHAFAVAELEKWFGTDGRPRPDNRGWGIGIKQEAA